MMEALRAVTLSCGTPTKSMPTTFLFWSRIGSYAVMYVLFMTVARPW